MTILLSQSELLSLAINIASTAHLNDLDKGGNPYILHPLRLMMRLRTNDFELMQMAVLHDVVEDHGDRNSIEFLKEKGFSDRVLTGLTILTHDKNVSYDSYLDLICTNIDCVRIKIEDLRDNSDITRLKGVRDKDNERVIKYHNAYLKLKMVLDNHEKGQCCGV